MYSGKRKPQVFFFVFSVVFLNRSRRRKLDVNEELSLCNFFGSFQREERTREEGREGRKKESVKRKRKTQ